jgi:hypothetical protein
MIAICATSSSGSQQLFLNSIANLLAHFIHKFQQLRRLCWFYACPKRTRAHKPSTTPITPWSAVTRRRTGLWKRPSQGRAHSAIHTLQMRCTSIIILMCSCLQKSPNLKNLTRNSSTLTKSISAIVTVTAKTPTHPELMGTVALGNW